MHLTLEWETFNDIITYGYYLYVISTLTIWNREGYVWLKDMLLLTF